MRVLVNVEVPASGYATLVINEECREDLPKPLPRDPRLDAPDEFVLENEHLRAEFHPQTGVLVSLIAKATGEELIDGTRGGRFRLVTEDNEEDDVLAGWALHACTGSYHGVRLKHVGTGKGDWNPHPWNGVRPLQARSDHFLDEEHHAGLRREM